MELKDSNLRATYWEGDRSFLPTPPTDDSCQKTVLDFMTKMDLFMNNWQPFPPEGDSWRIVSKDWFCADSCEKCNLKDPIIGCSVFQGVRPYIIWERK